MVCTDCEKKQTKMSNMDMWKAGSHNADVGHGKDAGRRLGANKLLSGNRYGNMAGGASRYQPYSGGAETKRCRLCKSMLHGDAELYCQHCAYKHGLCSMCGKNIADTSMYASGQVWDGSEDIIKDAIAKVDEEVKLEKKKAKNKGLVAAGLLGGPADATASDAAGSGTEDGEAAGQETINVTFGKEGSLGIVFTDEGWEIEDIVEDGAAAEMQTLHPGLCLIEIQGVNIVHSTDEEIRDVFSACGRPVRLTFTRENPRYADGHAAAAAAAAAGAEAAGGSSAAATRQQRGACGALLGVRGVELGHVALADALALLLVLVILAHELLVLVRLPRVERIAPLLLVLALRRELASRGRQRDGRQRRQRRQPAAEP